MAAPTPRLSLVIVATGRPLYLAEAIESCIVQSMPDFELIVATGDEAAPAIVERYREIDSRISIGRGVDAALCGVIATMDASDVSLPDRLERQLDYLDSHPEIACVTGATVAIRADGKPFLGYRSSAADAAATQMFRKGASGPAHRLPDAVVQRRVYPEMVEPLAPSSLAERIRWIFDFAAAGYHASAARVAKAALDAGVPDPAMEPHLRGLIRAAEVLGAEA